MRSKHFFLVIICGLTVSCTSVYRTSVQTLTPAEITFSQKVNKITLLAREGYHLSSELRTDHDKEDIDTMVLNTMHAISDLLKEQTLYENAEIEVVKRPFPGFPQEQDYHSLFDEYKSDQIVLIDSVFVRDAYSRIQESGLSYLAYELYIAQRWNVLFRGSDKIADRWISRDTLRWVGIGEGTNEALSSLPSRADALWDAAFDVSRTYAGHIAPVWTSEIRELFASGSYSQIARQEYLAGNIQRAISIWMDLLVKTNSEKNKALFSHNIAVACESLDDLKQAEEWMNKSLKFAQTGIKPTDPAITTIRQYSERIKQRRAEIARIENQHQAE